MIPIKLKHFLGIFIISVLVVVYSKIYKGSVDYEINDDFINKLESKMPRKSPLRQTTTRLQSHFHISTDKQLVPQDLTQQLEKTLKHDKTQQNYQTQQHDQTQRHNRKQKLDQTQQLDQIQQQINYTLPDLESLRMKPQDDKTPIFVLLATQARSGSTWLGDITSRAENSVYVYEPLQRLITQGYYKKNMVCFFNNICREPVHMTERHEFATATLYHLFTCQYSKLHPLTAKVFIKNLRTGHMQTSLKECLKHYKDTTTCLGKLEKECMNTTHRILKVIRISMELVHAMLDLWPNLKVVHLVRDPRGMLNSRQNAKGAFLYSRNTLQHSQAMCSRMINDSIFDSLITQQYPNRSKIVIYEGLAERPTEGARFLFDFIKSNLTKEILYRMNSTTKNGGSKKENYYNTVRSNSTQSAHKWRKELAFEKVKIVDKYCKKIYTRLGYLPFNTNETLRLDSIPSRLQSINIDGFV